MPAEVPTVVHTFNTVLTFIAMVVACLQLKHVMTNLGEALTPQEVSRPGKREGTRIGGETCMQQPVSDGVHAPGYGIV